jgi:hypothetical protein
MTYKNFFSVFIALPLACVSKPEHPQGGYSYPKANANVDTNDYSYPIKDLINERDSFRLAYYQRYWHQAFNEPNLSIRPQDQDVFRLTYQNFAGDAIIITLFENKIVAKQAVKGDPYPEYDSTRLSPLERYHYEILYWNFPIQHPRYKGYWRRHLDSLARVYPQLLDAFYYRQLLDKSLVATNDPLQYAKTEIPISKNKYYRIVNHINSSGYWKMSYETDCIDVWTDGYAYFLEANTKDRYNIVLRTGCTTDEIPFAKVCQELINAASLERSIKILFEK